MKLAVHVTFYYVKERLGLLEKVIQNIKDLSVESDIFIYTNQMLPWKLPSEKNIIVKRYPYLSYSYFNYRRSPRTILLRTLTHPYYLSWECRPNIEKLIDEYDVQMYIEDDIGFTEANLEYWLKYSPLCVRNNYNLGFLRFESDADGGRYLSDVPRPLSKTIEIEGTLFLVNEAYPYCGFWIYSKEELKEFIKSPEWKFDCKEHGIRERSAIGWHAVSMNRYKSTVYPLEKNGKSYQTPDSSGVHHMPNNYIGHGFFCQVPFPMTVGN